ncbi:MAG TPA: hypothetical protein VFB72_20985, partial [Verrucomicrobiae bacterium]|nr:hypothetical protein [Verrucomicrobiae bacterium]
MNTNALQQLNPGGVARAADIRAPKPPVEIPDVWLWVWGVLVVLAVIAAAYFAWRYWRKKASTPPPVRVISSHERARLKLQQALALISQPKPFCILVSDTARWYLEERFHFHAPERTTEEFLYELQSSDLLLPEQKTSLGEFLSMCDMVKFARYEPGMAELEALHQSAVRLIDET